MAHTIAVTGLIPTAPGDQTISHDDYDAFGQHMHLLCRPIFRAGVLVEIEFSGVEYAVLKHTREGRAITVSAVSRMPGEAWSDEAKKYIAEADGRVTA